jgi:hypothetical protein
MGTERFSRVILLSVELEETRVFQVQECETVARVFFLTAARSARAGTIRMFLRQVYSKSLINFNIFKTNVEVWKWKGHSAAV